MEKLSVVRQLMVAVSPQLAGLSVGGSIAFPTLLLEHLKSNESTIHVDLNTSSWIGSIYGLAGIPVIFLPMFMQWKGRKFSYILTCFFVIIGWLVALVANDAGLMLTSEFFHGLSTNSLMPISFLAMTEMLAPKYRFASMQIFGINCTLGIAIAGILGRFLHFKTVSLIMLAPVSIAVVISFFWPESPPWLACRGKFDKSEKAFIWLRGADEKSRTELTQMIIAQKEYLRRDEHKEKLSLTKLKDQILSRDFYIPALHIFILLDMMYWSGGDVIFIYFIEMVEKTAQSKNAAFYAGIAMYTILFVGTTINATLRRFNNKTVLLLSTLGDIICLILATIITFLQSKDVLAKDSLLCTYVLVGYIMFYSLGLNSMVFYIGAELMPVKHRSIGGALYIVCNCGLYASTLKASPYLLASIHMWGTFLLYTANAVLCALLVYRYVPETKGRTLQEIEDYYTYGGFVQRRNDGSYVTMKDNDGYPNEYN